MVLGKPTEEGESPVSEIENLASMYLSTGGTRVNPVWNLGGPPSKAKYEIATDSE